MRLRFYILFLQFFLWPLIVTAQNDMDKAYDYLVRRGEVEFSFPKPKPALTHYFLSILSIDKITSDSIFANANKDEFEKFLEKEIPFRVLTPAGEKSHPKYISSGDWDYYPTYIEYVQWMQEFETDYPQLCSLFSIGKSVQNRDLWFIRITSGVKPSGDKPKFMYSSSMHGDETVGFVLMLRLIDYLLTNYGTDERITQLVDEIEIYINPLFNPDGAYYGGDGNTLSSPVRRNANSKDLNRNFPDPRVGSNPDGPHQPETLAMMSFLDSMTVSMSANFHGGAEVVNFPWDTWADRHPDHTWLRYVSKEYADTAMYHSPPGYLTSINPQGFVKGSDWYIIAGGQQDFVTYFRGGREVTVELSNIKFPSASTLPDYWEYNYRSLLNYMEQVLFGIRGKVTDQATGLPLKAKIELIDHDADSSWAFSNAISGNFFRPVAEGVYSLRATLYGYKTKQINSLQVFPKEYITLNIELEPDENLLITDSISVQPNPILYAGELKVFINERSNVFIEIFDFMGRKVSGMKPMVYSAGEIIFTLNSSNLKPGLNFIRIRINGSNQTKKVLFLPE